MCQTMGCCRGGRTFVCFGCRTSAKSLDIGADGAPRMQALGRTNKTVHPNCPRCRRPMTNLGIKVAIPRKGQDRRWRQLEGRFGAQPG